MNTLEEARGISKIANNNNVHKSYLTNNFVYMKEYRATGCKYGDSVDGYLKWMNSRKKSLK